MWVHFETFHVNPQPAYCSKYPPGQSLFLAFGQLVLGDPWFGVCLSMALMFACTGWMLLGWVSAWPAMLTLLLCILGWGFGGQWMNSYWGGAVPAAGGALLIGAIPRLIKNPRASTALAGAAGLILLAVSRPFEGVLTACGSGMVLLWRMRRGGRLSLLWQRHVVVPFLLAGVIGAAGLGYYNYRTTGSATVPAYVVHERMYAASPLFYLLPPIAEPVYRHEHIRRFWAGWVKSIYLRARTNPWRAIQISAEEMWRFYFWTPTGLAIALGLLFFRSWQVRAALLIATPLMIGLVFKELALPHYLAPAFGALLVIAAAGLQGIWKWRPANLELGPLLTMALISLAVVVSARDVVAEMYVARHPTESVGQRPRLIERLERQGGRHLVIVHYGPGHSLHDEWVYNRADIDASDIVWAQDMGRARNQELLDYYRDRKVWLLQPDTDPAGITAYADTAN